MASRLATFVVLLIVSGTLIAGLIVGAQRDDNEGPVDLIVHNAVVYTAGERGSMAEAVAARGNQILRVGSDREIMRLRRPQTIVIDARGAAVLPGFNDARVELIEGGSSLGHVDLLGAASLDDIERRIREWADANPEQPWVLGRGWHADAFPDGMPPRHLLDRLVRDRPAHLLSADGRTAWVNTKALRLAHVAKATASPPHGAIVKDPRTGEPTGVLQGDAIDIVSRLLPPLDGAGRRRALDAAIAEAHRHGVTSLQDVRGTVEDFSLFADARRAGTLKIRVYSAVPLSSDLPDADLDRLAAATSKYPDDPLFKAGAVSLRVGGAVETVGTGQAARETPDLRFQPDALNRLMRRLDARGWQIVAEAEGDTAVALTLNAYEHATRSNRTRTAERRHRIENADAIADADLPRFGALGVLASMQPFTLDVPEPGEEGLAAAGIERATALAGVSSIRGGRGRIAFGTGWPASPMNPLLGLRAAIDRTSSDEGVESAAMSLKSAIDAYTSAGAWASFDEQRKGTIAPGMLADMVVLSDDIFSSPGTSLATAHVEVTIFDGKVVYRRTPIAAN